MRPKLRSPMPFLAALCVLAVLIAALSPAAAGLPPAILIAAGPLLGEPGFVGSVHRDGIVVPPELFVGRRAAARAPPLA